MKVTIDEERKTMTIVIDLQTPQTSRRRKNISSRQHSWKYITTGEKINGKEVTIGVNAYIRTCLSSLLASEQK